MKAIILRFVIYYAVFFGLMWLRWEFSIPAALTIFICKLDEIKKRL